MKKIRIIGNNVKSILKNHLELEYQGQLSNEAISILVNTFRKEIHLSEVVELEMWMTLNENDNHFNFSLDKGLKSKFYGLIKKWIVFEKNKHKEFDKAILRIENLAESKKYILPTNWAQFYYGKFLNSCGLKKSKITAYDLRKLPQISGYKVQKLLDQANLELNEIQELNEINIISHKLKILEVSGILDAVDEIFSTKYYKSPKKIIGQKSVFLAQIMGIPKEAQKVWDVLRKNEYHTGPALKAAEKLFKETGVEKFFIDKEGLNIS